MHNIVTFVIVFFTYDLLAIEYDLTTITPNTEELEYKTRLKIKDIDFIIKCGDCCYPTSDHPCDIFYILCNLKDFHENFFAFSTKQLADSDVFSRIKNNYDRISLISSTGVFIIKKNVIYFNDFNYNEICVEMLNNIMTLQQKNPKHYKALNITSNYIHKVYKRYELIERPKLNMQLQITTIKNIRNILSVYNKAIAKFNNDTITIYNSNVLTNCIRQEKLLRKNNISTMRLNKISTIFPVVPTNKARTIFPFVSTNKKLYSSSSAACCNDTTNYNLPVKTSSFNNIIYIVISVVSVVAIIAIVIIKYYKQRNHKKNNNEVETFQEIKKTDSIDEHIYEEPYFPDTYSNIKEENKNIANIPDENKIKKQQISVSNDIIKLSKNIEDKQLIIVVVNNDNKDPDNTNKAMLINLPPDQSLGENRIIEIPAIKDDRQQHIYNVLENGCGNHLVDNKTTIEDYNTNPSSPTNDTEIHDDNTHQNDNATNLTSSKTNITQPNVETENGYINVNILVKEVSDTAS